MSQYSIKIQLINPDGTLAQETNLFLQGSEHNDNINIVNTIINYATDITAPEELGGQDSLLEGKVITPLPPDNISTQKIEGIVTPKPPLQVAREENIRLKQVP